MEMKFPILNTPETTVVTQEVFHHNFISILNTIGSSNFDDAQGDDAIIFFNALNRKMQNLVLNTLSDILKIAFANVFNYYYDTYTSHLQVVWSEDFREKIYAKITEQARISAEMCLPITLAAHNSVLVVKRTLTDLVNVNKGMTNYSEVRSLFDQFLQAYKKYMVRK